MAADPLSLEEKLMETESETAVEMASAMAVRRLS
jgi:hypothetical protein